MSQELHHPHPLEQILRMCARQAPQPWYPRYFIRQSGADPDEVDALLRLLALEGLVQKVPGTLESGSGLTLTPLGEQVLADPDLLERLQRGEPVRPEDPGSVVRSSLRQQTTPYVTYALIAVNVLIFALQERAGLGIWKKGVVSGALVEQGEWYRLLTCMFLHGFLGHLLMNMFSLYVVGSLVERTWGWWRYLIIYFIGGWGGSCLGVAYTSADDQLVGASGAICAVFGAVVVWALLYGRYLPADMMRRLRSGLIWSVVLTVGLALLAERMAGVHVSHAAHLGGVIVGALTAVVLHFQRFGGPVLHWVALLLLVPLPWLSYVQMEHARKSRPAERVANEKEKIQENDQKEPARKGKKKAANKEEKDDTATIAGPFLRHYADPVSEAAEGFMKTFEAVPLNLQEARNDTKKVKAILGAIPGHQKKLRELQQDLKKARYANEEVEKGRLAALELVAAGLKLCDQVKAYLTKPDGPGKKEVENLYEQLNEQTNEFQKLMDQLRKL
jgi:membrane associated rhomboid family serine protease